MNDKIIRLKYHRANTRILEFRLDPYVDPSTESITISTGIQKGLSTCSFTVEDEAFALLMLLNKLHAWDSALKKRKIGWLSWSKKDSVTQKVVGELGGLQRGR